MLPRSGAQRTSRLAVGLICAACATTQAEEPRAGRDASTAKPTGSAAATASAAASASTGPASDAAAPGDGGPTRPARWAQKLDKPGLPNLHRVSETYYRGAQPTAEGMAELSKLGVRAVVNLRSAHSDRDEIGKLGLAYHHINVKAWHAEDEDVVKFLRLVTDAKQQPVFVHCQHGADRTGMMTAIYRMAIQGWSKDDAIAEMTQGGFGFHAIWGNLVEYVRQVDVEKLRKQAGIPAR